MVHWPAEKAPCSEDDKYLEQRASCDTGNIHTCTHTTAVVVTTVDEPHSLQLLLGVQFLRRFTSLQVPAKCTTAHWLDNIPPSPCAYVKHGELCRVEGGPINYLRHTMDVELYVKTTVTKPPLQVITDGLLAI